MNHDEYELSSSDIEDLTTLATGHVLKAKLAIGDVWDKLAGELGDWVHTISIKNKQRIYDNALKAADDENAHLAAKGYAPEPKVPKSLEQLTKDYDPEKGLTGPLIFNMARAAFAEGHRKFAILDRVTEQLQTVDPSITRDDVSQAYTDYGKVKYPSKEDDLVALREAKTAERIQKGIDDLIAGKVPLKTGAQRDNPTEWVRQQQLLLKETMKRAGIVVTHGEGELKEALGTAIVKIRGRIAANDYAKPTTKAPVIDAEKRKLILDNLNAKRDWNKLFFKAELARRIKNPGFKAAMMWFAFCGLLTFIGIATIHDAWCHKGSGTISYETGDERPVTNAEYKRHQYTMGTMWLVLGIIPYTVGISALREKK